MQPAQKLLSIVLLCGILFSGACKKKENPASEPSEEPPNPVSVQDTGIYACKKLPPPPEPFGWTDSTLDVNRNVSLFMSNPLNPDEMVIVVNGDLYGLNKMYNINLKTKQLKFLANIDDFMPDINSKGWVVYSTYENNIYRIKANGDSLRPVSTINVAQNPQWDHTGTNIYFFQQAYANVPAQLVKANPLGQTMTALPHTMPHSAPFRKSDKIVIQREQDNIVTLVLRNMSDYSEKELIRGPYSATQKVPHFGNLSLDQNDENLYWSNNSGIFRCNLSTLKTDTLFKNCENRVYSRPKMSLSNREFGYSLHLMRVIGYQVLFHHFETMEYDIPSGQSREIKIF